MKGWAKLLGVGVQVEVGRRRLAVLDRIAAVLYNMVDEYFEGDARLRHYVEKRVSGAREIVAGRGRRVRAVRLVGPKTVRMVVSSSLAEEGRAERRVLLRTLEGGVVEASVGVPLEQLVHFTEVSPSMLRCTCQDAVYAAAAADSVARAVGVRVPVFHRYSICKHVLAALTYAVEAGVVSLDDPVLRRSLRLALLAAYLRIHRGSEKAVRALRRFEAELEPITSAVN